MTQSDELFEGAQRTDEPEHEKHEQHDHVQHHGRVQCEGVAAPAAANRRHDAAQVLPADQRRSGGVSAPVAGQPLPLGGERASPEATPQTRRIDYSLPDARAAPQSARAAQEARQQRRGFRLAAGQPREDRSISSASRLQFLIINDPYIHVY